MSFIGQELALDFYKTPFKCDGQVIGYPFCLDKLVTSYGKKMIPNNLGIYHLFYKDRLVYIGMSKRLRGRLIHHLRDDSMPFDGVLWFVLEGSSIERVLNLETKMIKKFKPSLNVKGLEY